MLRNRTGDPILTIRAIALSWGSGAGQMTRVTVSDHQEPQAFAGMVRTFTRSCLPSCRQPRGRGRDPGQGGRRLSRSDASGASILDVGWPGMRCSWARQRRCRSRAEQGATYRSDRLFSIGNVALDRLNAIDGAGLVLAGGDHLMPYRRRITIRRQSGGPLHLPRSCG